MVDEIKKEEDKRNVMAALPNIVGALCSTPQSLAEEIPKRPSCKYASSMLVLR